MIHPSHGVQIFVATKPVDFRKGHDGLAALVQSHLQKKPFDGAVYVFRAKRVDRLKMILLSNTATQCSAGQWVGWNRIGRGLQTA
ncbi:IS66 family insertion sequence element accessory protein TnpB [Falsihalocynthiibacter sp. S25ZX9]|uniref:IS66 family insertion sequence element accessory protein TnpB n=1 Tax=Falsihalocynthiibacter sp. S25ZX9 TaxID=3240870 RepID=UPI00350F05CD